MDIIRADVIAGHINAALEILAAAKYNTDPDIKKAFSELMKAEKRLCEMRV